MSESPQIPPRILLVDDDAAVRRVLERSLRAQGLEVVVAADGVEALDVLEGLVVDVVVSDVTMPRMNGLDLLIEIRKRAHLVPVILLTGTEKPETRARAHEHGVFRYFLKPIGDRGLHEAIREALAFEG